MGVVAAATASPKALWYLTRGAGLVTLILLTLSVALGVANQRRTQTATVPRFAVEAIHRSASLLALVFLSIHVATAVLDTYAPIRLIDAFVPLTSAYRPLWLGLGALASDLLIAVAVTSVLRRRLGYHAWRVTHWTAYACWPIALVHGLGTGSDVTTTWMLTITACCVLVAIAAIVVRATDRSPPHNRRNFAWARATTVALSALIPLGLLAWLLNGPLAAGWARRAGTPSSLLRTPVLVSSTRPATGVGSQTPLTAQLTGVVRQGQLDGGLHQVHLVLTVGGQHLSTLGIRLIGEPAGNGGVDMTTSRVELGTSSEPAMYRGQVTSLDGSKIGALVSDSSGTQLMLNAQLQIDPRNEATAGTLTVRAVHGG